MKNTDPPNQNKFEKLSPELARFIESMGMYFESSGVPRIGGRILGLLMIAYEPLSANEIARILKVSRASISTNFRVLLSSGLAEKVSFPGDRTTYFAFPETSWEKIMNVEIEAMSAMKKLAQQGLDALSSKDSARGRMEGMINWADFLIQVYQNALLEWRIRTS
jgi:DNA-binding transcriptional regulator GbsR (MarR family)